MRLSVLPVLLTGLSAVSLVAAEPIRVVEAPSSANANIRFGLALANANVNGNDDNGIVRAAVIMSIPPKDENKGLFRHCGASLREKALRISNAFRQALGMPLIEADAAALRPGEAHTFVSSKVIPHPKEEDGEDKPGEQPGDKDPDHPDGGDHEHHPHHGHHGHHGNHGDHEEHGEHGRHGRHGHHGHHGHHGRHGHHHTHHKSFLRRLCKAIKALGPWEGRAVAFVLGCGIGVLLRMFWVLAVLTYRTVRGERSEETFDREYIVYEQVSEPLFDAPPEYADEKVSMEAHDKVEERK